MADPALKPSTPAEIPISAVRGRRDTQHHRGGEVDAHPGSRCASGGCGQVGSEPGLCLPAEPFPLAAESLIAGEEFKRLITMSIGEVGTEPHQQLVLDPVEIGQVLVDSAGQLFFQLFRGKQMPPEGFAEKASVRSGNPCQRCG